MFQIVERICENTTNRKVNLSVLTVAIIGSAAEPALVKIGLRLVLQVADEAPSRLIEGGRHDGRVHGYRAQIQSQP